MTMNLKNLLIFPLMLLGMGVFAQVRQGPVLELEKDRHNYGTLYADELSTFNHEIEITNTGDEPLVLSNVRACCGTRVIEWPREPLMPQEKASIKVQFRLAPRPQRISRTVTINSNSSERPTFIYRITGQVVDRDA